MASRYAGLRAWHWAVVIVVALANAITTPTTSTAMFAGALTGSLLAVYGLARLLVYLNKRWSDSPDAQTTN